MELNSPEHIPVRFMLIDSKNRIRCVRETTKEERLEKRICEDFKEWKQNLIPSDRYLMAAEILDQSFSTKYIAIFKSQEWAKEADSLYEKFDKPEAYKAPCIVTGIGNPELKRKEI